MKTRALTLELLHKIDAHWRAVLAWLAENLFRL